MAQPRPAMAEDPPAPARPAPTVRLDPAGTESPQAATVHLDTEPEPVRLDAVAVNSAAGSIVQHALEIVLPIVAFLAVILITVPLSEFVNEELQREVSEAYVSAVSKPEPVIKTRSVTNAAESARTTAATLAGMVGAAWMVLRVLIAYRVARYVSRWVSGR